MSEQPYREVVLDPDPPHAVFRYGRLGPEDAERWWTFLTALVAARATNGVSAEHYKNGEGFEIFAQVADCAIAAYKVRFP